MGYHIVMSAPLYLAVLGKPAFHSLSPAMHNAVMRKLGIKGVYLSFEVDNFEKAVIGAKELGFKGLNVTLPYKENAYRIADEMSEDVKNVKAANTIHFEENKIKAFNTDIYGFSKAVERSGFSLQGSSIAVIGAGGVSRAIVYSALRSKAKEITIFNRTYEKAEKIKEEMSIFSNQTEIRTETLEKINFEDFDIIVNATNIGWKGENLFEIIGIYPKPIKKKKKILFFDTVYVTTKFLSISKELGYNVQDGRWMLVLQGAMSFKIWTSIYPDERVMFQALTRCMKKF